jgi:signal recognition particle GTPase
LCSKDGVAKENDALNILGVISGSNTMNALKQVHAERIQKVEIAALSITREERKTKRAQKRSRRSR